MLLLGIDLGTSFVKASVMDADTKRILASASFPDAEVPVIARKPGWAEQSPELWWYNTLHVIKRLIQLGTFDKKEIKAIGISYQMHGLVVVDSQKKVLRDAIIWCDGRTIDIGNKAKLLLGDKVCREHLLNDPGNFTASKLAWVKENEPEIFQQIDKFLLPGDFIAMKLTGEISTTVSALSEGIFWDFKKEIVSEDIMNTYGFDYSLIPKVINTFTAHGQLLPEVASELGLSNQVQVSYKGGDQLTTAFSLNVLHPGDTAANAGTSGVLYSVIDSLQADVFSRINSFAHVNHSPVRKRLGVLLCINGAAIMYGWARKLFGRNLTYDELNSLAASVPVGSLGVSVLPFGNGPERMLRNRYVGAGIFGVGLNSHDKEHILRAILEGIAFSFRFGLDIMRENNIQPVIVKAAHSNLFLSEVFAQSFVNTTGVPLDLYTDDGSAGASLGAGVGIGVFPTIEDALSDLKPLVRYEPSDNDHFENLYQNWLGVLNRNILYY